MQQVRSLGQPAPERMCDEHMARFNELLDREIPCRNQGCQNTWMWKRGAQLALLQRTGKKKPPARLCDACFDSERNTKDVDVPCRVDGCKRNWRWDREAQLRHRAWVRRQEARLREDVDKRAVSPEADGHVDPATEMLPEGTPSTDAPTPLPQADPDNGSSGSDHVGSHDAHAEDPSRDDSVVSHVDRDDAKRRRRRGRRRGESLDGTPARLCKPCSQRLANVQPKDIPCKVHGCSRTWTWDRISQLKSWAVLGIDDLEREVNPPKRMCDVCREFCRTRPDRTIACGRPGCDGSWVYKTGAQLQAFLAGRVQDPIRLCDECIKGDFLVHTNDEVLPVDVEIMPCVVPGCGGTWTYVPGTALSQLAEGELPLDRLCESCREQRQRSAGEPTMQSEGESVAASEQTNTDSRG